MMERLCVRFPCVMTTPLGAEVEPEVNCRKHGAEGSASGAGGIDMAVGEPGCSRLSRGTHANASGQAGAEAAALKRRAMSAT